MSKTRAGGCVATPLPTPAPVAAPGSRYGKQDVYSPQKAHVQSQKEHGLHCDETHHNYSEAAKHWK